MFWKGSFRFLQENPRGDTQGCEAQRSSKYWVSLSGLSCLGFWGGCADKLEMISSTMKLLRMILKVNSSWILLNVNRCGSKMYLIKAWLMILWLMYFMTCIQCTIHPETSNYTKAGPLQFSEAKVKWLGRLIGSILWACLPLGKMKCWLQIKGRLLKDDIWKRLQMTVRKKA